MIYSDIAIFAVLFAVLFDLFIIKTQLLTRAAFWTSYAIILPFQLITNWWLTSRNIVMYSPDAIMDVRVASAPVEDLLALSACAKKLGLKLILDIVTNHTGDVIQYADKTAYLPADMKSAKSPAWLNKLDNYHNVGSVDRCWGEGRCEQIGDFYSLDDLATEKPEVYQGWVNVYSEWIKKYGFEGFRVDTARHVDNDFFKNWSPGIDSAAKSTGISNFTIFGEVYDVNPMNLVTYVRERKIQTVLDFAFQRTATQFASGYSDASVLATLFNVDDQYTTSTSTASNLVTFLGNHDMGRVGFIIPQTQAQAKNDLLARTKLAHALMYFSRGIPTVYYGDEVGMTGSGNGGDQRARQDMFETKITLKFLEDIYQGSRKW